MFAFSAVAVTAALTSAALPNITKQFCADARDFLVVDNVTKQDIRYRLCVDSVNVQWRRDDKCSDQPNAPCTVPGESAITVGNASMTWQIMPIAPNKYTCKLSPAMPASGIPYHFIVLDPTTLLQPTQVQIDGKTADDWLSDRKPKTPGHGANEEFMHW